MKWLKNKPEKPAWEKAFAVWPVETLDGYVVWLGFVWRKVKPTSYPGLTPSYEYLSYDPLLL